MIQVLAQGLVLLLAAPAASAQTPAPPPETVEESYKVYTEAPRLFLRPQRLRLLRRERERKSLRWEPFRTLMAGGARMPEPGFAWALYGIVTGEPEPTRKAIEWAAAANGSVRDVALVYDWCRPAMTPAQAKAIEGKLARAAQSADPKVTSARDRVLAAIAVADANPELSEKTLKRVAREWWPAVARDLEAGKPAVTRNDTYALFELLHAFRDNLNVDLRTGAPHFFKALPADYLLCNYPPPYPAAENEYRIPAFPGPAEPDPDKAALARAAGLAMVAYDNNATESQFLQGWLLQDRFLMRGPLGIAYEFMWANPYQPGLPYFRFPLTHHDPRDGHLFIRSSWEEDALWFGVVEGQMQLFSDGKMTLLNPKLNQAPIEMGSSMVVVGAPPVRFNVETGEEPGTAFVVGLKPRTRYNIEVDDEELSDGVTDSAGTLPLPVAPGSRAGVRIVETATVKGSQ